MPQPTLVIDGHSDVLIDVLARRLDGERGSLARHHLPRWREGRVDAVLCPIAVDNPGRVPNDTRSAFEHLHQIREEVAEAADEVTIALSAEHVRTAARDGRIALVLGLEGGTPLGDDPAVVHDLHTQGIRWVTLTWNDRNQVGSGVGVPDDDGLTEVGRRLVAALNDLGVLIDVSHAGPATLRDAVAASRAPVVASHSNARAVCDHVRNLADDQIRAIVGTGGTVGVNLFPSLVAAPTPTLDDVIRHIDHLRDLVGTDAITLGADFIDFAEVAMGAALAASSIDYGDRLTYPDGLESTTKLPNLFRALEEHGYRDSEIRGVAADNLLRVLERVQACASVGTSRA